MTFLAAPRDTAPTPPRATSSRATPPRETPSRDMPPGRATSPMLLRLAARRATGALLRETGTVFLADGEVVHAESPAAPGLDVLLTATGRLSASDWNEAVHHAGARCEVARHLVEAGRLGGGELEIAHLGALFDAAYFALAPGGGPTRFRKGAVHWLGPVRPVPAYLVQHEAERRRALLDRLWPDDAVDTAPVRRAGGEGGAPAVTRRQAEVLDAADGRRTPAAIAHLLGRPAYHTLIDVRRLAAAGLLDAPSATDPPPSPAPLPSWVTDFRGDPDVALLRRLRDALEAQL